VVGKEKMQKMWMAECCSPKGWSEGESPLPAVKYFCLLKVWACRLVDSQNGELVRFRMTQGQASSSHHHHE